ncbi:Uncharacterised protein [Aminobacter aminovorans]|uniref:Uncharacterized protein n=1 Tax=Aminobacter aminovorans TaxID=83263 RepID=A0A381IMH1_AMIAI|nr:Uncharacterised protein [Aminobacter aminovorans]
MGTLSTKLAESTVEDVVMQTQERGPTELESL